MMGLLDGEEITVRANFTAPENKFRIHTKEETDDAWILTGEWIEINIAGYMAGLRPGMTEIYIKKEKRR